MNLGVTRSRSLAAALPMPDKKTPKVNALTAADVAKMLRLSRNSVYEAAGRGEIPCRRIGRRLIFSADAIALWLAGDYAPHVAQRWTPTVQPEYPMPTDERDPDIVTAHQMAELLGVGVSSVYEATGHGDRSIPHQRVGGRLVFSRRAVFDWLDRVGGLRAPKHKRRRMPVD